MSEIKCACCGAVIDLNATECKYCGEVVVQPVQVSQPMQSVQQQYKVPRQLYTRTPSFKSKTTAGILAILLGGLGVHKFYLGKCGIGIIYILFCWTYIPVIIGVVEGIIYLASSDEQFVAKYIKR